MRSAALIGLALVAASCVQVGWNRESALEPIEPEQVEALVPGEADLGDCLDALGAPVAVWEYQVDGLALAWAWRSLLNHNVSVSVPVTDQTSASYSYTRIGVDVPAWLLLFDGDWELVEVRRANLSELEGRFGRRRPGPLPEDATEDSDE